LKNPCEEKRERQEERQGGADVGPWGVPMDQYRQNWTTTALVPHTHHKRKSLWPSIHMHN